MEIRAAEIIAEMTTKPVVCAHTLTMQLDSIKRTITACLNARLLPIIADLISHVKATMAVHSIHAPLMVVRGDGTLMSEETARHTPVETILSGPAASVCGAQVLSGVRDGLVVDIGGTTSDIAVIINGDPIVTSSGASVADWNTNVCAVDIETIGLGGDSIIALNRQGELTIGPRRAIPLAYLAHEYPYILDELNNLWTLREINSPLVQPTEFFRLMRECKDNDLTGTEERMLAALKDGPRSRRQIAELIDVCDPSLVPVERMETSGVIQQSTLTLTDIMHVLGLYTVWNREASEIGLRIFAHKADTDTDTFAARCFETFSNKMTMQLLHRVLRHRQSTLPDFPNGPVNRELLRLLCTDTHTLGLSIQTHCDNPLVAIGAPAQVLAQAAAKKLGAQLIVPEHAEVANAVGAISGVLTMQLEGSVLPIEYGFAAYTPEECQPFNTLEEAREWLHTEMAKLLEERIQEANIEGFALERTMLTNNQLGTLTTGMVFLEYKLRAIAVGRPIFQGFV
jgi:N-methylhydantoinase A/oxoprolinase/acetone carboxylase beta subunit